MPARRGIQQQAPEPGRDYADFPVDSTAATKRWFRHHTARDRADHGAWYFSTSPAAEPASLSGRFDLPEPDGTCYLASTPHVAVRELIGPDVVARGWVGTDLLDGRVVSELKIPHDVRAADVSVEQAADHRVSAELTATPDYGVAQAWARVLRAAGFDAIRYSLRFTPGTPKGLALFAMAGVPNPPWAGDPSPQPVRDYVVDMGVDVVEVPTSTTVSVVNPTQM